MRNARSALAAAVLAFTLVAARPADADPKLHFLKSKKFWVSAAAVAVPGTLIPVCATRGGQGQELHVRRPPTLMGQAPLRQGSFSITFRGK